MAPMTAPPPATAPATAPPPTKLPANPPPQKTTQIEVPAPTYYYPAEGTVVNYGYSYVSTTQPVYYVNYRR